MRRPRCEMQVNGKWAKNRTSNTSKKMSRSQLDLARFRSEADKVEQGTQRKEVTISEELLADMDRCSYGVQGVHDTLQCVEGQKALNRCESAANRQERKIMIERIETREEGKVPKARGWERRVQKTHRRIPSWYFFFLEPRGIVASLPGFCADADRCSSTCGAVHRASSCTACCTSYLALYSALAPTVIARTTNRPLTDGAPTLVSTGVHISRNVEEFAPGPAMLVEEVPSDCVGSRVSLIGLLTDCVGPVDVSGRDILPSRWKTVCGWSSMSCIRCDHHFGYTMQKVLTVQRMAFSKIEKFRRKSSQSVLDPYASSDLCVHSE